MTQEEAKTLADALLSRYVLPGPQTVVQYAGQLTFSIAYSMHSVAFTCPCGTPLELTRRSPETSTSGVFCLCQEHYWIDWKGGVLHKGREFEKSLQEGIS